MDGLIQCDSIMWRYGLMSEMMKSHDYIWIMWLSNSFVLINTELESRTWTNVIKLVGSSN